MSHYPAPLVPYRLTLFIFLVLFFLCGCATLYKPPSPPLSKETVKTILSGIREQDSGVFSCYMNGQLTVKNWVWSADSNILIVGTKDPYRIKIEVTHSWGRPILHVLIDKGILKVLSFEDNRLYISPFTPEALSEFFPGHFDTDLIWAILRGYPNLQTYHRAISLKPDQISLFNVQGEALAVIDFNSESRMPIHVLFPQQDITLEYSDFQKDGGIVYAREIKAKSREKRGNLVIKNKNIAFNKTIPEGIFVLEKPPSFETFYLDHSR
jgi:hypothetical protein